MKSLVLTFILLFPLVLRGQATYGPEFEFMSSRQASLVGVCGVGFAAFLMDALNGDNPISIESGAFLIVPGGGFGIFAGMFCNSFMAKLEAIRLRKAIEKKCLTIGCKVVKSVNKSVRHGESTVYRVVYPDGWYFQIDADVSAVEIQARPSTSAEIFAHKGVLQRDLFDVANGLGMKSYRLSEFLSQGHINIGYAIFKDNDLLYRNFIVDQLNHSELATGILANDNLNAASPMNNPSKIKEIQKIIADFDSGKIKGVANLSKKLENAFLSSMNSISLRTIYDDKFKESAKRLEVRAHRAQKDAEEFYKLLELYDGRIEYLKKISTPIALVPKKPVKDPLEQLARFKTYVEESGKNFDDYLEIMPNRIRKHIPNFRKRCLAQGLSKDFKYN